MNTDLRSLCEWLRANKLSLNVEKTELLIFRPPNRLPNHKYKLKLDGKHLQEKDSVKYLGIHIDKHLKWKEHAQHLYVKLNQAIGILSKLRYNTPLPLLKTIYHALFESHMYYGCQVWFQGSKEVRDKIQELQKPSFKEKYSLLIYLIV